MVDGCFSVHCIIWWYPCDDRRFFIFGMDILEPTMDDKKTCQSTSFVGPDRKFRQCELYDGHGGPHSAMLRGIRNYWPNYGKICEHSNRVQTCPKCKLIEAKNHLKCAEAEIEALRAELNIQYERIDCKESEATDNERILARALTTGNFDLGLTPGMTFMQRHPTVYKPRKGEAYISVWMLLPSQNKED